MKRSLKKFLSLMLSLIILVSSVCLSVSALTEDETALISAGAKQITDESIVLLKNNGGLLPLKDTDNVAVFGAGQYFTIQSTFGSGGFGGLSGYNMDALGGRIIEGIKNSGIKYNTYLADLYNEWATSEEITNAYTRTWSQPVNSGEEGAYDGAQEVLCAITGEQMELSDELMKKVAGESNVAIVVLSHHSGEGYDWKNIDGEYKLSDAEKVMLEQVKKYFSNIVVVLNTGNSIDMTWEDDSIDSILYMCLSGSQGGNSLADILSGKVTPSGKLNSTWAYQYTDFNTADCFGGEEHGMTKGENNRTEIHYNEGIYVGYRYFDTFNVTPRFEFGYGLSYTTFDTEILSVSADENNVSVQVKVTNTGNRYSGKEVVQVYFSAPDGKLEKAYQELAAYGKTDTLAPGESQTLTLSYATDSMKAYDEELAAYIMEAGDYIIRVGNSSRNTTVAAVLKLDETKIVEQLSNMCTQDEINLDLISKKGVSPYTYEGEAEEIAAAPIIKISSETIKFENNASTIDKVRKELQIEYSPSGSGANGEWTLMDVYTGKTNMKEFVAQMSVEDLNSLGGSVGGLDKYGIPRLSYSDGPFGVKGGWGSTGNICFPSSSLTACSFNEDMSYLFGELNGVQAISGNIDLWLAPGMNTNRNPLGGRNPEYYSEDPVLGGTMAAATVRGCQSKNVGCIIKHYAANDQETDRKVSANSVVSERELREIILKQFEICVKTSDPWGLMATYCSLNSVPTMVDSELLIDIPRGEWGWNGITMTDWGTKSHLWPQAQLQAYGFANGLDCMMGSMARNALLDGVNNGYMTLADAQESVTNKMNMYLKSNAFAKLAGKEVGETYYTDGEPASVVQVEKGDIFTESGLISSPKTVHVGENFNVIAAFDRKYTSIKLVNEKGNTVTMTALDIEPVGDMMKWDITTKIGTAGTGRVISILGKTYNGQYEDLGCVITLDVIANTESFGAEAEVISARFAEKTVTRNTPINMDIVTNTNTSKVGLFNENGNTLGKKLVTKVKNSSEISWKYEMKIGTAGTRIITAVAANDSGVYNAETGVSAAVIVK